MAIVAFFGSFAARAIGFERTKCNMALPPSITNGTCASIGSSAPLTASMPKPISLANESAVIVSVDLNAGFGCIGYLQCFRDVAGLMPDYQVSEGTSGKRVIGSFICQTRYFCMIDLNRADSKNVPSHVARLGQSCASNHCLSVFAN